MKGLSLYLTVSLSLIFASGWARAEQGCPDGFTPNAAGTPGMQCIPIGGQTRPGYGSGGYPTSSPDRWEKRWGAFTSDSVTGKVGVSSGVVTKRKAEKEAVQDCRTRGGSKCEVLLTFNNQCGAIASGDNAKGGAYVAVANAPTKTEAAQMAVDNCNKRVGSCSVFLTECSYAERVQ